MVYRDHHLWDESSVGTWPACSGGGARLVALVSAFTEELSLSNHGSKTFLFVFFLAAWLTLGSHAVRANTDCGGPSITTPPSNAGTVFLLCFEENIGIAPVGSHADGYLGVYLASTGDTATVTITSNLYPGYQKVIFLKANGDTSYDISDDSLSQPGGMRNLWIDDDEEVNNAVVQVSSTSPVVCYGLDYKPSSADAFCALPGDDAGTDYSVLSYPSSPLSVEGYAESSEFAVAAFEDNTVVTIVPTARTVLGSAADSKLVFVLQRGQCVQVQADSLNAKNGLNFLDLTGSTISATHPVAVYAGHARTAIDSEWFRQPDEYVDRSMLLEAMPPTSAWGNVFVLDPIVPDATDLFGSDSDIVRVLALNDSTHITINGAPWTTLNRNQFADTIITGPMLIASDGALLTGEMEHSEFTYGSNGDPFLAIVAPMGQTFNSYTFFLPRDTNFRYQSVIVAADTTCARLISVDGQLIPFSDFRPAGSVNGTAYAIAEYPLAQGVHTISTPYPASEGFTILAYGDGVAVAYGYAAGSLLVPQRAVRIDNPPQAIMADSGAALDFRNTAYQPAYLDSARFIPNNEDDLAFGIHPLENITLDIGRMDIGAASELHLISEKPLSKPVSGVLKVYSHLPSFFAIEPAELPVMLEPASMAAVANQEASTTSLSVSPNPFAASTTLRFTVPQNSDVHISLFDELGRMVRQINCGEVSAGIHSFTIARDQLPAGIYSCEIDAPKSALHLRIPIVAEE
ncbi:MAG TPA: hypothetical protein VGM92_07805 [Candidatus Kapabacteria bacterium]